MVSIAPVITITEMIPSLKYVLTIILYYNSRYSSTNYNTRIPTPTPNEPPRKHTIDKLGIFLNSTTSRRECKQLPRNSSNWSMNSGIPMNNSSTNNISSAWKRALPRWSDTGRKWSDSGLVFRLKLLKEGWMRQSETYQLFGEHSNLVIRITSHVAAETRGEGN